MDGPFRLFGRHVTGRAEVRSAASLTTTPEMFRQTEVGDLWRSEQADRTPRIPRRRTRHRDAEGSQQDVGGLEVPVNDPVFVRVLDGTCQCLDEAGGELGRLWSAVDVIGQVAATDQFGSKERLGVILADIPLTSNSANRLSTDISFMLLWPIYP